MIDKIAFGKYEITKNNQSREYNVYDGNMTLTLSEERGEKLLHDLLQLGYLYFSFKEGTLVVTQDESQLELDEEESFYDIIMSLLR